MTAFPFAPVGALVVLLLALEAHAEPPKGQIPVPQQSPKRQIQVPQDLLPPSKSMTTDALFAAGKKVRDHRDETPQPPMDARPQAPAALTLLVPVTVKRIGKSQIKVICNAGHGPASSPMQFVMADGEREQGLPNGSFNGTLPVPVNPRAGMKAQDMKRYSCTLMVPDKNGTFQNALYDQDLDRSTLRATVAGAIP